eukprot:360202-Chlamydomonas_euryale.AAC.2
MLCGSDSGRDAPPTPPPLQLPPPPPPPPPSPPSPLLLQQRAAAAASPPSRVATGAASARTCMAAAPPDSGGVGAPATGPPNAPPDEPLLRTWFTHQRGEESGGLDRAPLERLTRLGNKRVIPGGESGSSDARRAMPRDGARGTRGS